MHSLTIINASQTFLISHNTFAVIIMKKPMPWFILHALDVSLKNPFAELIINSADTDVFLQLVYEDIQKVCSLKIPLQPCLSLLVFEHPSPQSPSPTPPQVRSFWLELTLSPLNFYTCET